MSGPQQSGSGQGGHKVKVAVRVRPFLPREVGEGARNHWLLKPKEIVHLDPETQQPKSHKQQFMFDNVFGPDVTTKTVYDEIAAPIVSEAFNGFNGTILCYGQTSSGKTHTLYGNETDPGIITYLAEDIQKRIEFASSEKRRHVIRMNLIEIYNEHVRDLLSSENPIEIVERNGAVVPANAEHMDIVSATDITRAAERLQRERRIGETRMNTQSSRSHTILRMTINTIEEERDFDSSLTTDDKADSFESPSSSSGTKRIISAVLNFVDLAGSEKASQTGAVGERLREAGHINTSLSALSKVVSQLSKQWELANKKDPHNQGYTPAKPNSTINSVEAKGVKGRIPAQYFVSYRDSKLTRILQSSLAGGALIAIICNATPASSEETLGTLRFALSAKEIQTKPQRNLVTDKLDKMQYENTIQELRAELFDKNEELRVLTQLLQKTKKEDGEDAYIDRRQTFHFQPSRATVSRRLSMIPEKGLHHTLSIGQGVSLMDFREAVDPSPCVLPCVKETGEQEIQTDLTLLDEIHTPTKKRKLNSEESQPESTITPVTPVSTLRMQRSMLAVTIEEDKQDWLEEKALLQEEIQLLKKENQENCSKLDSLRSECNQLQTLKEEKATLSKGFETYKEKHFDEIATLKLSKEYEVDLLNQQVVKRDQQIMALKTMSESNEKREQEFCELKSKLLQQTEELESTKEKLEMVEKEMASKVQTTCSIEQQTDEMTVDCNCEKPDPQELEELRSLAADFENFKEKHLDEISSLKQSQENEVLLLNHQVVQRDGEIAAFKEMSKTQDNEREIITQELCELKTSLGQLAKELLLEKGNAEKLKLELEDASQKPSTISIEQQTDEMIYECNCEKEELRILSADFETFKVQHFNEITSLTRSKENEVTSLTEQLTYRDQEITALKNTSETHEIEQEKVTAELSEARTKVHQLTSELLVAEGNVEKLKTELEDLRNLATDFDNFKQQHFEEIESVNNFKQSKESEITSLTEQLTCRDQEITALKNTSQTHEMEQEKVTAELSEAMAKVDQLTSDLLLTEGNVEKLKTELEDASQKPSTISIEQQTDEMIYECNCEKEELRILSADFETFKVQHFNEITSLTRSKENEVTSLTEQLTYRDQEITALKNTSETHEIEQEKVTAELSEAMAKVHQLTSDLLLAEGNAEKLKTELEDLKNLATDFDNFKQQHFEEIESLTNFKQSKETEITSLTEQLTYRDQEITALKNTSQTHEIEKEKIIVELSEAMAKVHQLTSDLLLAQGNAEKLKSELDGLRNLAADFDNFKQQHFEEIESLTNFKQSKESEITSLTEQLTSRDQEMTALKNTSQTHEMEKEKIIIQLSDARAKVDQLTSDLLLAQGNAEKLKSELDGLRNLAADFDNFKQQHFEEIESLNNFKQSQDSEVHLLNDKIMILNRMTENEEREKERVIKELCEVTTKWNQLQDALALSKENVQKLEKELDEALTLQKCLNVVSTEQQTDLTTLECFCNKLDPVEVERINKELEEVKSNYEKERSKLTDEIDVLKTELKAWDKSMTEELREDLKASWNVNKELETKISEMKLSMLEKDSQLSGLAKSLEEKATLLEHIQELKKAKLDNDALLDNLRSDCSGYQALHDELSTKLEKLKENHSEEIVSLKQTQESELVSLHHEAMKRNEEMKALEAVLETRKEIVEELQTKLRQLTDNLTLAEENTLKLKMEVEQVKMQKLSAITVEQQTDKFECDCIKPDPEIQRLAQELEDVKSASAAERTKLSNEIESLQKELKAGVGDKSTNVKYTEKLKEDLKASWKDNKELETQLSDLKTRLQGKETELSSLTKQLEHFRETELVPPEQVKTLEVRVNNLEKEKEALQASLTEGEKKLIIAETRIESLLKELDVAKSANVRRRPVVNRGNQTEDSYDAIAELRDLKVLFKQKNRDHETAKKRIKDLLLEQKNEAKKYEAKDKEKDDTLKEHKKFIEKIQKEAESAKERRVDQGIQCEYIVELLEKSRKGELVTLPPEFPNIGKLQDEIRQHKTKLYVVEDALAKCKCDVNIERRKRLLGADRIDPSDPDLKDNSQPDSDGLRQPPQRKYMRMGHASDRKGNGIIPSIKPTAFLPGGKPGSSRGIQPPSETLQNVQNGGSDCGSTTSKEGSSLSSKSKEKSSTSPPQTVSGTGIQTRSKKKSRQDLANDNNPTHSGVQTRSRRGEVSNAQGIAKSSKPSTSPSNIPSSTATKTRSSTKRKLSGATDGGDEHTNDFLKWLNEEHK